MLPRSIANPFKGTFEDETGKKHIAFFEEGKMKTESLVAFSKSEYSEDLRVQVHKLTIPKSQLNKADEIIRKKLIREGYPSPNYKLVEQKEIKSENKVPVLLNFDHKTLVLGAIKIAYEATVNFFPDYFYNPQATEFRNILLQRMDPNVIEKRLDEGAKISKLFWERVSKIPGLRLSDHCILLEFIPDKGLVCFIRLFDFKYAVVMSDAKYRPIEPNHSLFICNDALTDKYVSNIQYRIREIRFDLKTDELDSEVMKEIHQKGEDYFVSSEGRLCLYDETKDLIHLNVDELAAAIIDKTTENSYWAETQFILNISEDDYYLKTQLGDFIKILTLSVSREVVLLELIQPQEKK
jgi:hypothetical protein